MLNNLFKGLFYLAFLLGFAWVAGQLFYKEQTDTFVNSLVERIFDGEEVEYETVTDLRIIFPDEPASLEPTIVDPATRQRTVNIYESLTKCDRDLNPIPFLAKSWGLIDDLTWDMRLREGVVFHDGSTFDADDVLASFARAKNYPDSQLRDFYDSIKDIEVITPYNIRIMTHEPDPLLLQKLSMLQIIPAEYEMKDLPEPIGTGSYEFVEWTVGESLLIDRFDDHWGQLSVFESVELLTKTNTAERVTTLLRGEADFLAFVPQDSLEFMRQNDDFEIRSIPSLEVQFLLFNMNSEILSDVEMRTLVSLVIDQESLVMSLGELVKPINQFISTGVFGFNVDIPKHVFDLDLAKEIVLGVESGDEILNFHLPEGLDVLGEHVKTQLREVGIRMKVSYLDADSLIESFEARTADIYFLAFKSGLGDSSEFLNAVAASNAKFNLGGYSNSEIDEIIKKSTIDMNIESRLISLQNAMSILIEDDVIGVPLFEFETVYSFVNSIDIQPRIDGLIYFDEIKVK